MQCLLSCSLVPKVYARMLNVLVFVVFVNCLQDPSLADHKPYGHAQFKNRSADVWGWLRQGFLSENILGLESSERTCKTVEYVRKSVNQFRRKVNQIYHESHIIIYCATNLEIYESHFSD